MAVRKKGSRRIVVDGITYLWRFPPRPTHYQHDCWPGVMVTVSREDCRQAVLVIGFPSRFHASIPLGKPVRPVLPSDVAKNIRSASSAGWPEDAPGPTFFLTVRDDAPEVPA